MVLSMNDGSSSNYTEDKSSDLMVRSSSKATGSSP